MSIAGRQPDILHLQHAQAGFGVDVAQQPDQQMYNRLASEFPESITAYFWWTKLAVVNAPAIDSTSQCAMYLLRSISTDNQGGIGQEFFLGGYEVTLCPGDVSGLGGRLDATSPQAWGSLNGDGYAYIVIGMNLGLSANAWNIRDAFLPGLGSNAACNVSGDGSTIDRIVIPYPPGTYDKNTTSAGAQLVRESSSLPLSQRVVGGNKLDIAFCIGGSYFPSVGASANYYGYTLGAVKLGLTKARNNFTNGT